MGKLFVPDQPRTPTDRVRETLSKAERFMPRLRRSGPSAVELLHLIDQIAGKLDELEEAGVDVRPERSRLETIRQQLGRQKARFLAEAGEALQRERQAVQPDRARWWWFLDETLAQERKRRWQRFLRSAVVVVVVLGVAWLLYESFLAPSPEEREAYRRSLEGGSYIEDGDLEAAVAEFEAAVALDPTVTDYWLWIGAIYQQLGDQDKADDAFATARSLYDSDFDFLLGRAQAYTRIGNLDAADADLEQAIAEDPESGIPYYLRHSVALGRGDYTGALDDLEKAAELASAAGDTQLEGLARAQRAYLLQAPPVGASDPTLPEGEE